MLVQYRCQELTQLRRLPHIRRLEHLCGSAQFLQIAGPLPNIEVGEPFHLVLDSAIQQAAQARLLDEGPATGRRPEDAKRLSAQLTSMVVPGAKVLVGRWHQLAIESFLQVLLEQFRGREHQPTALMRQTLRRCNLLHDTLLVVIEILDVQLLPQATNKGGGFACSWGAEQHDLMREWEAEDFVLKLVENGLISQAHAGNHVPTDTRLDRRFFGFLSEDFFQQIASTVGWTLSLQERP